MFGKKKIMEQTVKYDPESQYPVIRSSICTGEKVAGFKDKTGGHFTEVMLVKGPEVKIVGPNEVVERFKKELGEIRENYDDSLPLLRK